jgi:hypothetical protein
MLRDLPQLLHERGLILLAPEFTGHFDEPFGLGLLVWSGLFACWHLSHIGKVGRQRKLFAPALADESGQAFRTGATSPIGNVKPGGGYIILF